MLRRSVQRLVQRSKLDNTPRIYKLAKYNQERVEKKTGPKVNTPEFQTFLDESKSERFEDHKKYLDSILPNLQDHLRGLDLTRITEFDFFYLLKNLKGPQNRVLKKEMARKYFYRYAFSLTLRRLSELCVQLFVKREPMDQRAFIILMSMLGKALGPEPADYVYINDSFKPEILADELQPVFFVNLLQLAYENYRHISEINQSEKCQTIFTRFIFRCLETFKYFQVNKSEQMSFVRMLPIYKMASDLLEPTYYPDKKVIPKQFLLFHEDIPQNILQHPQFAESTRFALQQFQDNFDTIRIREISDYIHLKALSAPLTEEDYTQIANKIKAEFIKRRTPANTIYFVNRLSKLYFAAESRSGILNEALKSILTELKDPYQQEMNRIYTIFKERFSAIWANCQPNHVGEVTEFKNVEDFNHFIKNLQVFHDLNIADPSLNTLFVEMVGGLSELIESKRIPFLVSNLKFLAEQSEIKDSAKEILSDWISLENQNFEFKILKEDQLKSMKFDIKEFFSREDLEKMPHVLEVLEHKITLSSKLSN